jgi:hypothetical protein
LSGNRSSHEILIRCAEIGCVREDMDLPILAIEPDSTPQAFAVCVPKTFVPTNLATEWLNLTDDGSGFKMLVWELDLRLPCGLADRIE